MPVPSLDYECRSAAGIRKHANALPTEALALACSLARLLAICHHGPFLKAAGLSSRSRCYGPEQTRKLSGSLLPRRAKQTRDGAVLGRPSPLRIRQNFSAVLSITVDFPAQLVSGVSSPASRWVLSLPFERRPTPTNDNEMCRLDSLVNRALRRALQLNAAARLREA